MNTRWVEYIANLHPTRAVDVIVEATDSDYILIAMLHYEKQCKFSVGDGENGLGRVILRRIQTKGKEHAAGEKTAPKPKEKKGRQMEHVHIPLLCEVMSSLVKEMFDSEKSTPMMNLVSLVALGGTDFVRATPRIGPHRMWELLPLVLRGYHKKGEKINMFKSHAMDEDGLLLDEDIVCDIIMYKLYCEVFSGHVPKTTPSKPTFQSLSKFIKSPECRLGNATKESFPTMEMLATTIRNISWNLSYWVCASRCNMQVFSIHPYVPSGHVQPWLPSFSDGF